MLYRRYKNNNVKENKVFGLESFYPHSIDLNSMISGSERDSYTKHTNSEMSYVNVENDVSGTTYPVFEATFETTNPAFHKSRLLTTSSL